MPWGWMTQGEGHTISLPAQVDGQLGRVLFLPTQPVESLSPRCDLPGPVDFCGFRAHSPSGCLWHHPGGHWQRSAVNQN
jgi:hypothetical protein